MKPWQFYTLTVIGICLIALTGAISYSCLLYTSQVVEAINYSAVLLAGGQNGLVQSGLSLVDVYKRQDPHHVALRKECVD